MSVTRQDVSDYLQSLANPTKDQLRNWLVETKQLSGDLADIISSDFESYDLKIDDEKLLSIQQLKADDLMSQYNETIGVINTLQTKINASKVIPEDAIKEG